MDKIDRRVLLGAGMAMTIEVGILASDAQARETLQQVDSQEVGGDKVVRLYYLEIVTPDVEEVCAQLAKVHGVKFSDPDPNLGGARTTKLVGGGLLGVRGPLRESEAPVVRPYVLVEDIKASVKASVEGGAELALEPMELPGHGQCSIVVQGGIDFGLWQR